MPIGQPPLIETAEELDALVKSYFDGIKADDKPPTVAGLAYHLGFASRQSVYDYGEKNETYAYILKRARLLIEAHHEGRLTTASNPTGSIYWTKNHGWSDRQELALFGSVTILDDVPREGPKSPSE